MKSIIKDVEIEAISKRFAQFFATVEAKARSTTFVQRASPMTGLIFLQTLLFGFMKNPRASLNQLAQETSTLGVSISPQGLDERIHERSVEFIKAVYQNALDAFKNQQALPIEILKQFTRLFIVDSTFKCLPESMAEEYPGSGGKASKASLKVQLVFEFIYGNLSQVVVEAGRCADQAYRQYLDLVESGALIIMDLGYFCLASLRSIADQGAFFILRYHYPTCVYRPNGTRMNVLDWVQNQPLHLLETPILLGASVQYQVACRLISVPVPPAVAEERRRKARRNAQTHGKTLSEAYLRFLGWSVYVTNVPASMLSAQQVLTFYRIRWQIELMFKLWKSYCGLEHIPAARKERVLTEFYAKLLVAVLVTAFMAPVRIPDGALPQRELSAVQVRKILANFAPSIAATVLDPTALSEVFHRLYRDMARFGFKQIRRLRPNLGFLLSSLSIPGQSCLP